MEVSDQNLYQANTLSKMGNALPSGSTPCLSSKQASTHNTEVDISDTPVFINLDSVYITL